MLENFKLYAADTRCKHIFFAATNCPKYIQLLEAYGEMKEKITLVSGSVWDGEIRKLGFEAVAFRDVFYAAPAMSGYLGNTVSAAMGSTTSGNGAVSRRTLLIELVLMFYHRHPLFERNPPCSSTLASSRTHKAVVHIRAFQLTKCRAKK
jgi:hypothetical protein